MHIRRMLKDGGLIFVVLCDYVINEDLYRRTNGYNIACPVVINTWLCSFGNTSMEMRTTIQDGERKNTFGTLTFRYAHVDSKTRRPKPLPDYFVQAFKSYQRKSLRENPQHILNIPPHALSYVLDVRYSDTDFNKHTNNSTYIKLCMDCATVASMKGNLTYFTGDVCRYNVKTMKLFYWSETRAGDKLTVYLWENKSETDTLNFHIQKNGSACFGMSMQFNNHLVSTL